MNDRIATQIWHDALQCSMKPFSWGLHFNDIKVIENGTSFYVQGKVCGWIKIQLTEDNRYDITITPDNALESEVIYRTAILYNLTLGVLNITLMLNIYKIKYSFSHSIPSYSNLHREIHNH